MKKKTIFIMIIMLLAIYFAVDGTPWGKDAFENKVNGYLMGKYPDIKFRISASRDYKNYSFLDYQYYAVAYPKTAPDLRFVVRNRVDYTSKKYKLSDNFISTAITYKINANINNYIKTLYSKNDWGMIKIAGPVDDMKYLIKSDMPNYYQIRSQIHDPVEIAIYVERDFNKNQEKEELEKINKCIQFIKLKNYDPDYLYILFREKTKKDENHSRRITEFEIDGVNLKSIKNSQDVARFAVKSEMRDKVY